MKIIIRPVVDPQREVDLTRQLISAIAEELWRLYGGNDQLNWLEAEQHLEAIVADARAQAAGTEFALMDAEGGKHANGMTSNRRTRTRRAGRLESADLDGRRNVRIRKPVVLIGALAVCSTA